MHRAGQKKLVTDIAEDKWFVTPEIIETNLAWQTGHLTLSQYYYTVVLINGSQIEFAQKISKKNIQDFFRAGPGRWNEVLSLSQRPFN